MIAKRTGLAMLALLVLSTSHVSTSHVNGQEFRVLPAPSALPPAPVQIALDGADEWTFTAPLAVSRSPNGMVWYGGGPNMELVDFLASQHNQKQIEFSSEQKSMLSDFQKRLSTEYTKIANKYPELKDKDLSRNDRRKINQTVHLEYQKVKKKMSKDLEESLVPQQLKIVKQLRFNQTVQMYGFTWAMTNAPFKEDVDLSDKQKDEMTKIKKDTEAAIQKKITEMREEAKEKMLKLLSKKQRDKVKELEGEKKKNPFIRL